MIDFLIGLAMVLAMVVIAPICVGLYVAILIARQHPDRPIPTEGKKQ